MFMASIGSNYLLLLLLLLHQLKIADALNSF